MQLKNTHNDAKNATLLIFRIMVMPCTNWKI